MGLIQNIFLRAFGRPKGVMGRLGGIIMARSNWRIAAQTVELLDIQSGDTVLEVGFGPGVGIQLISEKLSSGRIAGVDCSQEMVNQAVVRNALAIDRGRVKLRLASVESLPFETNMFDKILAINSMQIWSDVMRGLREILRVLKPHGCLALGFTPYSGQTKEGLVEIITEAGFADAHVVDMDKDFCALAIKPGLPQVK
jgi:ubiquinone/menaquinone biosynthesis C-methylase UbiE